MSMIQLPVIPPVTVHEDMRTFGSRSRPLRPSKLIQFIRCPMSAVLTIHEDEGEAGEPAQTGNLVHSAAAAFHKMKGDLTAGLQALDAAREKFPRGLPEKADRIFRSYAADPENQGTDCLWVEEPVRVELEPAPHDPTGEPVVIVGTLDQVRRCPRTGKLQVWDIKTGSGKDANDTVVEYLVQQAAYCLAARETLDESIIPGGIIYTPGYDKPRGRRFLPLSLSVDQCRLILVPVVYAIAEIRRGIPAFRPGADSCRYCPSRPFTNCLNLYKGVYS